MGSRLFARNIDVSGVEDEKDKLALVRAGILENLQVGLVSNVFRNPTYSGEIGAGTVEFKRFENAQSHEYGTARSEGKGKSIKAGTILVHIDQDREIIEEIERRDVQQYGYGELISRRALNHYLSLVRELDTAFFAQAVEEGEELTTGVTNVRDLITDLTSSIRTTKNEFVDGVPSELIGVVLSPEASDQLRKEVDILPAQDNVIANGFLTRVRGYNIYESNHLPEGVHAVALLYGSVAQPRFIDQYEPSRIPLSNADAVELFYSYGTKSLTPELIRYSKELPKGDTADTAE